MGGAHICLQLEVPREEIAFISWCFDACDGTAILRVDDGAAGIVSLLYPEEQDLFAEEVLDGLAASGITIKKLEKVKET